MARVKYVCGFLNTASIVGLRKRDTDVLDFESFDGGDVGEEDEHVVQGDGLGFFPVLEEVENLKNLYVVFFVTRPAPFRGNMFNDPTFALFPWWRVVRDGDGDTSS